MKLDRRMSVPWLLAGALIACAWCSFLSGIGGWIMGRDLAQREQQSESENLESKLWQIPLAVNGPPRESQLQAIDAAGLRERLGAANYRWVEKDEPISLAGAQIHGQDLWKWLLLLVLIALLAELLVLAWPLLMKEQTA